MSCLTAEVATHFFLGRQPILDLQGKTYAYELLFRCSSANRAHVVDEEVATTQVILRAFSELGLQAVTGEALCFINLDARLLSSEFVTALPRERVVFELLETTRFDAQILDVCHQLHARGYRLALDDLIAMTPEHKSVLPFVSYIKVDLLDMPESSLRKLVAQLKPSGVTLLAEKVETQAQFQLCKELGFDYFQGYYFAHPELLCGRNVDPSHQQMLRLTRMLTSEAPDTQIEAVFKEDAKLTYNLLRVVNSVAMGLPRRIQSVHHAMLLLGRKQLQRWVSLLLFAHRGKAEFPNPLAILAACRGRFMELLAKEIGVPSEEAEQAFMTGMISLLDAALEIPMIRIADELGLDPTIRAALLERSGRLGDLLRLMEYIEQCDTARVDDSLSAIGIDMGVLTRIEIEAMQWANDIGREQ